MNPDKVLMDDLVDEPGPCLRAGECLVIRGRIYEVKLAYKKQGKFVLRERRNLFTQTRNTDDPDREGRVPA